MDLGVHYQLALAMSHGFHHKQFRKDGTTPYPSHILAVASIVMEFGTSEDEVIAALFHDAAEDQGGKSTLEVIRKTFGESVARLVLAVSDTLTSNKNLSWKRRKEIRLKAIRQHKDPSIRVIEAADLLHNVSRLSNYIRANGWIKASEMFKGGKDIVWYYKEALRALLVNGSDPLIEELERAVFELLQQANVAKKDLRGD